MMKNYQHICSNFRDVDDFTHRSLRITKIGIDTSNDKTPVSIRGTTSRYILLITLWDPKYYQLYYCHFRFGVFMEVPPSDEPKEEIKPIIFPDGSIELDHSDITLSSCSFFITVNIHHQEGFFYEVYYRDGEASLLFFINR